MSTHRLAPGTVLGRYELLLPIAQGGMATVWAARQKGSRGFSKTVAVKTMLPNLSEDETFEQMFLDEAAIASKIHHPNVAEILDLGEQDEILYLVMEWVDGESLSALSKQTKKNDAEIPIRVALKIVSQACAGLHAAHELRDDSDELVQLVHRDVSPQNILCSSSGMVKLVDFGVAKAMGRSGATNVGQLKGKVPYMSPEQTRGQEVDRRTDLFAMGSVLYRISTGFHPFIEDNDVKTMRSIAARPPIRPSIKNAKLPDGLEAIILKALEKLPSRRYQTAADLGADIDKVLAANGGPVSIDEVGAFVRMTLGDRDQKRRAALRDAATAADENRKPNDKSTPPARISSATISDMMLTQTSTPPSFPSGVVHLPDEEPADSSDEATRVVDREADDGAGAVTKIRAPESTPEPETPRLPPTRASEPPAVSSPTLVGVIGSAGPISRTRTHGSNRSLAVIGIAAALVLAAGATLFLVRRHRAVEDGALAPARGTETEATSPGSFQPETDHATAAEPTAPDASPTGSALAAPAPEREEKDTGRKRPRAHGASGQRDPAPPAPKGTPATKGGTEPDKPASPPPPAAPGTTAKPWVPTVQDPGF